ncbi:hypothetical protein [Flagellimonas abyssi]|uniref:Uncharacterized protein n=1 Tax=Flagellimonas abyssi TaxID=2864871 RepID=A0ABS7ES40_9FLAO|nr:hypothetical protein [Allomuricauda abyssi]MBW8199864.1 hypothetical protein [Allomuricauda abyssi]
MKYFFLSTLFFLVSIEIFSQDSFSLGYSIKGWSYGSAGALFQRSVLILERDSTYVDINESYLTRKLYKKNLPWRVVKTFGVYSIVGDTLILKEKDNPAKKPEVFIIKSNRRIKYYDSTLETEYPKSWKKILSPKFGNLRIK